MNKLNGLIAIAAESQNVASTFSRHHKGIVAVIQRIIKDLELIEVDVSDYFAEGIFKNDRNRDYPNYVMSEAGFKLLFMTLEGAESMIFKLELIKNK